MENPIFPSTSVDESSGIAGNAGERMAELSQKLQLVRELVRQKIEQYTDGKLNAQESILIQDNSYAGHRFHGGRFLAQWLIGKDSIQIFFENKLVEELEIKTRETAAEVVRKAA